MGRKGKGRLGRIECYSQESLNDAVFFPFSVIFEVFKKHVCSGMPYHIFMGGEL